MTLDGFKVFTHGYFVPSKCGAKEYIMIKTFLTGIFVIAILSFSGCAQIKSLISVASDQPIARDAKALVAGIKHLDWPAVHDNALRLQDAYVVLSGAETLRHEYGLICTTALETFFDDPTIGTARILRRSPLIDLIEKIGTLRNINAITIGRVIHVGKSKVLNLPHEVEHVQQWRNAGSSFAVQYLPTILVLNKTGYDKSIFEQQARKQDIAFTDQYGPVCTLNIEG